jgi:hypothetical protein
VFGRGAHAPEHLKQRSLRGSSPSLEISTLNNLLQLFSNLLVDFLSCKASFNQKDFKLKAPSSQPITTFHLNLEEEKQNLFLHEIEWSKNKINQNKLERYT